MPKAGENYGIPPAETATQDVCAPSLDSDASENARANLTVTRSVYLFGIAKQYKDTCSGQMGMLSGIGCYYDDLSRH